MDTIEAFIKKNLRELVQVYLSEKLRHKEIGIVFIDTNKNENNVYYLPINLFKQEQDELKEDVVRRHQNSKNTAFFYVFDDKESKIIEIEL
jgi:hypothetical protein